MKTQIRILLTAILLLLSSCGGGTSGTGLGSSNRSITGTVLQSDGTPLIDATVTLVETGESDNTDAEGNFEIITNFEGETFSLLIENESITELVEVTDADNEVNTIHIDIGLSTQQGIASVKKLTVEANIVGFCDPFFENRNRIKQANPVPPGTACTLKFWVKGDGKPLANVPGLLQYSGCLGQDYQDLAGDKTNNEGIGQVDFTYTSDGEHCLYRFSAPVNVTGVKPARIYIDTFRYQNFLEEN